MSSTGQNRILIIGGGFGGLALAQGLKRARPPIPFHIFKRNSSADFRLQGYRIRINPNSAAYEDTYTLFNPAMSSLNAVTGQQPASSGEQRSPPPMPKRKYYNANRVVLQTVLLKGLEDDISFGKTFKSFRITSDAVEVTFTNGTKETGAILVSADSTKSHIRQQLMPNYTVLNTKCKAIYRKTFTKPKTRATIANEFFEGICLAGDSSKPVLKLFTDTMEFPQDLSLDERIKYRVQDDYVYWVLCINRTLLGLAAEDLHGLDATQSVETTLEMTKSWHPTVQSLLQSQDPSASSTLAFFASSPEMFKREWDGLLRSPDVAAVTLLGDAAHPMTPVGGVGANSAFQEAADLCRVITRDSLGAEALQDYGWSVISYFQSDSIYNQPPYESNSY
ncbi:cercosporin toxin biosynthesis [Fusarium mexicanum]|uniref:Cercosporin toxin biosynthesis n=1 Tax=Fusarium mexicanum TaxID=751941 RepID=A0A8H5MPK9_9HYPO|nr:cercosporin toxin biosynthesis [Fusarium mexicanum]